MSDTYDDSPAGQGLGTINEPGVPKVGEGDFQPPAGREEFVFDGNPESLPEWLNKSDLGYGPSINVPASDYPFTGAYTTLRATVGDTVVWTPAKGARGGHFDVIKGEPDTREMTKRPAQESPAQLEDLIKLGHVTPDDLGQDAKTQLLVRSPLFRPMVEEGVGLPEKQEPTVVAGSAG
jgi:hypothetical protein